MSSPAMLVPAFTLAQIGQPLFGNKWLALAAILAGVAVFMAAVAGIGRWLAATHPATPPRGAADNAPTAIAEAVLAPEIIAAIAAAVAITVGRHARIVAVLPAKPPAPASVEMLMQQWSIEGRRQIYSSHQIR